MNDRSSNNNNNGGDSNNQNHRQSTRTARFADTDSMMFLHQQGSSNNHNNVAFDVDIDESESNGEFFDFIIDFIFGCVAIGISFGLWTVVILLYIIVRPFSITVYRRLANQIGLGSYLEAISLLLPNTRICLTGDSDVPSPVGTSILVSNHVMDADWYSLLMLGRCVGLRGSIKVFLRNEIFHLNKHNNNNNNNSNHGGSNNLHNNNNNNNNNRDSSSSVSSSSSASASANTSSPIRKINNSTTAALTTATTDSSSSCNNPFTTSIPRRKPPSQDLELAAKFFHSFLDFPLIDEEDYVSDRESLFKLLRSFTGTARTDNNKNTNNNSNNTRRRTRDNNRNNNHNNDRGDENDNGDGTAAPVHFLLFPEGWSLYNGENRNAVLARSNDFAKREGRPQLKHLLLPRTTGFNASISSLRESSPIIYDVTIAYKGYKGSVPPQNDKVDGLSLLSLWNTLRRRYPNEIHIRIKRYSMEEVLQDSSWLDKKWAEKDRMLQYFSRHNNFPTDNRGFCRHQIFDTRYQSMETSIMSFMRLVLLPCSLPILLFLSIPIIWTTFVAWILYKGYQYVFLLDDDNPNENNHDSSNKNSNNKLSSRKHRHRNNQLSSSSSNLGGDDFDHNNATDTPGSTSSQTGTPFIPATPFASPLVSNWHDMLLNNIRGGEK
jgi:cytoskeletal protein RodZ